MTYREFQVKFGLRPARSATAGAGEAAPPAPAKAAPLPPPSRPAKKAQPKRRG